MAMTVMAMMTLVTMPMVMMPIVMMMAIRPPVLMMVMMARPPVAMVVMPPLHVGRQLAGVALRGGGDARTDRRCRLRLLRGSRDNQERTEGGKSQNFLQKHVDLHGIQHVTANRSRWFHRRRDASDEARSADVNAT
ncbi:hypothetical protein V4R08_12725 [Nitrobacter sp. NHB1]|uniref:hypothetical protein n=1 Tax=Nitrobacter sp. NHB1 TaxID=3119830 RepID=UPI002FFDD9E8